MTQINVLRRLCSYCMSAMNRCLRHRLLGLFVSLALAALHVLMGAAEARTVPHGPLAEMVICSGEGTATILVDGSGRPLSQDPAHPCAKCLPSFAALPPVAAEVTPAPSFGAPDAAAEDATVVAARPVTVRARAPPIAKA
ncbi:hypothetical protein LAZ29_11270 [Cereibacter sphaeroides]|uniref:hypothetical protein n=1 Tax=Cereibacter sphaeroides TaxID=1063 RepID=UPI001F38B6C9|nr:hypothetical protein [Cereibacter sphaeroides]MCE6951512.1 hypothetical protein [Cereibacter sphaeroides]